MFSPILEMAKANCHTVLLILMCIVPQRGGSQQTELTDVRLIGGPLSSPNSGRVEVKLDGEAWLPVCDEDWNDEDGVVACRQLGYTGYSRTRTNSYYGEGTAGSGSVNRFRCRRARHNLAQCDYEVSPTGCGIRNGAGLICTKPDFLGCYSNKKKDRIFREVAYIDDHMTITVCLNHCRSIIGMMYAGLGKGKECYCGDETISLRSKKKDRDCKVPCNGDSDEVCGDTSNVSVYDVHLGYCPNPGVPSNSRRTTTGSSFRYGVLMEFACDEGFELVGAHSIQCLFDNAGNQAIWTESPPHCTEVVPTEAVEVNVPTRRIVSETTTSKDLTTILVMLDTIWTTLRIGITEKEERVFDTTMLTVTTEKTGTKDSKYETTMPTLTTEISGKEKPVTPDLVGQGGLTTAATVGLAVGITSLVACVGILVFILRRRSCTSGKSDSRRVQDTAMHVQQHSVIYENPLSPLEPHLYHLVNEQNKPDYKNLNLSAESLNFKYTQNVTVNSPNQADIKTLSDPYYLELDVKTEPQHKISTQSLATLHEEGSVDENGYLQLHHDSVGKTSPLNDTDCPVTNHNEKGGVPAESLQQPVMVSHNQETDYSTLDDYSYPDSNEHSSGYTALQTQHNTIDNPNTEYFIIEESANNMGSPMYNNAGSAEAIVTNKPGQVKENVTEVVDGEYADPSHYMDIF